MFYLVRIWSIHPKYLDTKGIVALWRECLLAQNVLLGKTKGYKNHPQLQRFKEHFNCLQYISNYLHFVCDEANNRNYKFNRSKIILEKSQVKKIKVTSKQLEYEWAHFLKKIQIRDNEWFKKMENVGKIDPHPLFEVISGEIEPWERPTSL